MKKLTTKIWVLMFGLLLATISFMYIVSNYLYEELYVSDMEQSMLEVGSKLQTMYKGGKVEDALLARIEDYSAYSNFQIFAVRNPRELSACVPFDIDYEALIGATEREQLLNGQAIIKVGYVARFDRSIISVILPFTDQNRLEGVIYLYYPLTKISELASVKVALFLGGAILFTLIVALLIAQGLQRIMRPLRDVQQAARKMSEGDYSARVDVATNDEIGQLATAFNEMAFAIQREDERQKLFLATVSHELRTPLSYVKGYSELIAENHITAQEKEQAIQLITREASRMERLTNELLQLAKPADTNELVPIVLAETMREVMALMQNAIHERALTMNMVLDEELIVLGDEEKLKQIVINVLENAIRYSEKGGTLLVSTTENRPFAAIEIKDEGIGIPADDLPHITERFYRVNKARSRADGGSGLGLSIVTELVSQMNGFVTINSVQHEGTTVIITIPILEE